VLRVGFGQGTVEGCDRGVFSGVLPALDLQLLCDVGHPFDPDCIGTSRKSRRVAANVAGFQQARRLNTSMARTGRPSKGDRDVLYTRVPRPVGDAIRALSDQTGMAISDVVAALAAKGLGMPEWAPQPPHPYDQQELPLKTA